MGSAGIGFSGPSIPGAPSVPPLTTLEELYRNTLGREASPEELESWGFGATVDAGELDRFLGAARNEATRTMPTSGVVNNLAQQILNQGTTSQWGGEGYGSAQQNAYDMAVLLAGQGITDINQFGVRDVTVPEGYRTTGQMGGSDTGAGGEFVPEHTATEYYNKATGQKLESFYDKATGPIWGGTFAGEGSTAYGVQFAPDGTPFFYSQYGGSSNDFANLMTELGPIAQIGLAVATGGMTLPYALATNFAVQVLSGANPEDALKGAALSYGLSQVPGLDVIKEGTGYLNSIDPSGVLARSLTQAGTSALSAAVSGENIGDAMIAGAASGGVSGAVNALTSNIDGFSTLTPDQQKVVNNSIVGVISGKPLDQVAINAAISTAKNEINSLTAPNPADFESDSFKYDQVFDPKTAGMVDMSEQPVDQNYQFTTDFGVGADYSLGPKSDGQGFQITAPPEVFNPDGSVNYDLLDYDRLSQLGMDMPKSPNLDSMGGGQGLRIPVQGGYITEQGFTPEGYTPDLGDPNSFINQPAPGGDVSIQGALNAGAKATIADMNKAKTSPAAGPSGVDLNALMALLGGQQAAPAVVSSGQDNSADIELMQDIFGTNLSAPSAGNTDTQSSALARLLRG